eukprot:g6354.t1
MQAVMLRRLVESSDDDGGEALFDAIAGRNVPLALGLIHAGAAVRYSKLSSFPLTFAGSAGARLVEVPVPNKSVAIRAVEMGLATVGNTEALSLLLRANASVILHSTNNMKTTLLHGAVAANRIDMVDEIVSIYPKPKAWHMFLLGAGAAGLRHKKLRRSPRFAPPPGFLGKLYKKDVLRHIHSFLHKRRYLDDLDTPDSDGYTAAQYAKAYGYDDILKLLVENGAIMPCPGCALPSKAPPSLPSSSTTILLHDDDDDFLSIEDVEDDESSEAF